MHIFHIENASKSEYASGIGRYITTLISAFIKNSITFSFVSSYKLPSIVSQDAGVLLSEKRISNLRFFLLLFWFSVKQGNRKDHIFHLHHPYFVIPLFLFNWRSRYVLSLHSDQDERFRSKKGGIVWMLYYMVNKLCLKSYDKIISPSDYLTQLYTDRYKIKFSKLILVKQGVDLRVFTDLDKQLTRQEFGFDEQSKIILFIGRFVAEKRLDLLLDIVKSLNQKMDNLLLVLVGDGPLKKEIELKASRINTAIKLMDSMPAESLNKLINCADVLLVTSISEGGPLVVKEALACNVPVVSTDVGDVREVIEGIKGCFIAKPDVDDFSEKVIKALSAKNFESRTKMQEYSSEKFADEIIKVYTTLIN
ncbi:glycosyltransferase family 4 protein [Bacteroidota bacterium]